MKTGNLICQEKLNQHDQMNTPKVYIVILNYRQWLDTKDCLESVLKSSYHNFSIIIIDNNSWNNSLEHLTDYVKNAKIEAADYKIYNSEILGRPVDWQDLPRLIFIQNSINAGFAGGNNIILRLLAELDVYVWLLNPDMIIRDDTLAELVNFAQLQTADCIIGAEVRTFSGNQELLFYGGGKVNFLSGTVQLINDAENMDKLDYISGGCLFTHASNFKKSGLLPENYFLYWEETDWCYRAKQQGMRLLVCPSAVCYDKISTVIGKGFLANYYYSRNGLLFISKFRKRNIPIALFAMTIRWLKRIVTGQWGRARGVFRGTINTFLLCLFTFSSIRWHCHLD
jgi:GT2 family glycosyltransferase